MAVQLSNELEQSGWLTQNDKTPADVAGRISKHPDLIMDPEKLRFLKDFAGQVWRQRIELFKQAGWEDERTQGFPEQVSSMKNSFHCAVCRVCSRLRYGVEG